MSGLHSEGLVRQARNNSPGFSPFSRRATSQFFNAVDACEEFLNGLRAEARSNVVVAVCAQICLACKYARSGEHLTRVSGFFESMKMAFA
jgi:hypothetical protein